MADKELSRIRVRFVERASKALIYQLLDDVLDDGIVNDGERESIIEEHNSRADKGRCLIDTVRSKGPEASMKMITHIKHRDPMLYSELGLSYDQPAQPAAVPQKKEQPSATLIPATDTFWREKQNDRHVYSVTKKSISNRVALLITNITFTDERLTRNGAEKDEKNMDKLLKTLGYEVVKYTNLTGKAIDKAVIDFSNHPKLKETDSVVVVIMSHGKLGVILGVDWKEVPCANETPDEFPIDNIFKHLGSENCPALLNKPKIIIIQACRGVESGAVLVNDAAHPAVLCDDVHQPGPPASADETKIEEDTLQRVHREKDFISFLSCTPDTVSYRQKDLGSFLILYLVEVINNYAHNDDIEELFRKVMQRFDDCGAIQNKRQMPNKDRCSLIKHFYFFPGL